MKKTIAIALATAVVTGSVFLCASAADNISKFSSKFKKNFKDCDVYEETVLSEFQGSSFTTKRKIHGWKNGFCKRRVL